ncbi:alpha-amylase family glycosyl hydrolase [Pararobbsia alpina]|uniref:Malto-oligosyltrehalose trehalohydrolase n=1 Tax=Pararobbsia alpina TaxID=621374 RepID=A0A6S7BHN8_9BURK|nr:alpha-amylase family glycosyl hydrolase [Pararobbsia alpina]CAB3800712.1 1,4-alpha-glucan branching enzyme GlgB [Pararobbsia alpina]
MPQTPLSTDRYRYGSELPFGAHPTIDKTGTNRTHYRFWAPSCAAVQVEIQAVGDAPPAIVDMIPAGDGWFAAEADGGAGTRYLYRVDEKLAVPDPASRFQPEDVHRASEVVDPHSYSRINGGWRGRPWEEAVLYEMHVCAMGGYAGVASRLPELAELGVTAIEPMPLNDFSGTRNWGYDGVLPYAPDSSYGRPDDLKRLIDSAHGLGLMVFLDVVYNHFGPDGNYLSGFAKTFFREGVETPWGPAIDFERPQVRDFFFQNALFWLHEYRFDGLRLDAVHAIDDDGWLREFASFVRSSVEPGRHVHLVLENEHNTSSLLETHFNAQWSDDSHNTLHVLLTGEAESYYSAYATAAIDKLARVLTEGFVYQGEPSPIHDGKLRGEPSAHLPPTAFVMFFDYHGELADAVRGGRRREFVKFSAFTDDSRRAQIPDPNDADTFRMSSPSLTQPKEHGEGLEWLHFYRSALAVRAGLIVPRLRGAKTLGATVLDAKAITAGWRLGDGETLSIALNLGERAIALPDLPPGEIIFETPVRACDRIRRGELGAHTFGAWLTGGVGRYAIARDSRDFERTSTGGTRGESDSRQ